MTVQLRVTSLEPRDDDPCLIEVKIDGKFVGLTAREELDACQVQLGMTADDPCVVALKRSIGMRSARIYAMGILSRSDFPKAGLTRRLIRHGVEPNLAHDVVQEISQAGWVDDESYARKRLRSMQEFEGHSSEECRSRLKAESVDETVVDRLLSGEDRRDPGSS